VNASSAPSQTDLVIIGGGINGAGLAALAAYSGLSVVLFEKGDFASGTSSKSTKLIHGGIRYLEQGRLSLVLESLRERRHLLERAPHLVRPLPFLLPVYRDDPRPAWKLKLGLWLYDLLAGRKNMSRHRWFSPARIHDKVPTLRGQGLVGCGLYFDAQVNDARLVLENILAAQQAGARCLNYCGVTQVEALPDGFKVRYRREGGSIDGILHAAFLVNASGPWANRTSEILPSHPQKWVRPTRGTHIVVPQALPEEALLIQARDGRVLFVIPWRGCSLVGTTDLDEPGNPDTLQPTESEINYLLKEASRALPGLDWSRKKVISAFCGLRPLAWAEGGQASSVSREDRIEKQGRTLTIVGGKLTTYQAMAHKALKSIQETLGRRKGSHGFPTLPGAPQGPWGSFLRDKVSQWRVPNRVDPALPYHLAKLYGATGEKVLDLLRSNDKLREPLSNGGQDVAAQIAYAVREEKAVHLTDLLFRRLELGYGPQRWGPASETASRVMARELGWSEEIRLAELERYKKELFPAP
jgi:glycerol-3-phosphate dehydrogenase